MDLLKPYTTSRNSNGDNEHPCLNPLVILNKLEGLPFIKTTKFAIEIRPIIQSISSKFRPIFTKTNLRKPQSTLSYAFIIFSLRTNDLLSFTLILCKDFCSTPMASVICLPSRKPNCSFEMSVEREAFNLFL